MPTEEEADEILEAGCGKYGARFVDWLEGFGSEEIDFDSLCKGLGGS
ncbi:hypothetical protein [Streptomyces sp. NPDC005989]